MRSDVTLVTALLLVGEVQLLRPADEGGRVMTYTELNPVHPPQ